jgi:MFS family permease
MSTESTPNELRPAAADRAPALPFGIFGVTFFLALHRGFFFSSDVVFFTSRGLSFAQFSLLEVVSSILIALCEAPTGAIADRYGRRLSVGISCLMRSAIFAVLLATSSFGVIALSYALLGIAMTFQSGALNGWFASLCQKAGHESLEKPFLRLYHYQLAGALGGGLLTAALAGYGTGVVCMGAALSCLLAVVACAMTPDASPQRSHGPEADTGTPGARLRRVVMDLWTHNREAAQYVAGSSALRTVLIYKIIIILAACGTFKTWQPLMQAYFPDDALTVAGLSWSAFVLCSLGGNTLAGALGWLSVRARLILCGVMSGLPLLLAVGLPSGALALSFWGLYIAFDAIKYPLLDAEVHENAPDTHRSTVESLLSLVEGTLEIFGYLLIAAVAFSLSAVWPIIVGAALLHIISAAFVYIRWHK